MFHWISLPLPTEMIHNESRNEKRKFHYYFSFISSEQHTMTEVRANQSWVHSSQVTKFQILRQILKTFRKTVRITEKNSESIITALYTFGQEMPWTENDSTIFDYMLELHIFDEILQILDKTSEHFVDVYLQFLQTINIIFTNIKNKNYLFYLMSNNRMNKIILFKFPFNKDENLLCYYITLLRVLSTKLNQETYSFFNNDKSTNFPLYFEAIKYSECSNDKVRSIVKQITLNVYRVKMDKITRLVCNNGKYLKECVEKTSWNIIEMMICVGKEFK